MGELLTEKVQGLVSDLSELVDLEEEKVESDERYTPENGSLQQIRRRAAGLRRFLAPQRRSTPSCHAANGAGLPMPMPITGTS